MPALHDAIKPNVLIPISNVKGDVSGLRNLVSPKICPLSKGAGVCPFPKSETRGYYLFVKTSYTYAICDSVSLIVCSVKRSQLYDPRRTTNCTR
eukprot:1736013-Pyramimonas_sp.AAC.3